MTAVTSHANTMFEEFIPRVNGRTLSLQPGIGLQAVAKRLLPPKQSSALLNRSRRVKKRSTKHDWVIAAPSSPRHQLQMMLSTTTTTRRLGRLPALPCRCMRRGPAFRQPQLAPQVCLPPRWHRRTQTAALFKDSSGNKTPETQEDT